MILKVVAGAIVGNPMGFRTTHNKVRPESPG